jgi:phosphomannomutase
MFYLDDATYASLVLAEILSKTEETLHQLVARLPSFNKTPPEEVPCDDVSKFAVVERVKQRFADLGFEIDGTDGVKASKGKEWILIRASNTMPQIRINAEGTTIERAERILELGKAILMQEIHKIR